ncbi:type VI secretion system secreted protein VgrG [Chryseobacterium ginsenosidimutans]|uniref:type VI secretion system Vgr family protein n=1 Tax=Chryseobacterium ginsenosidimutans TaxID=687846 RepID=UPI00277E6AB3|nr:type VI secretion system Vgr family protein [Chryseobacterium ginsenosidimutans]MDQ0594790.1 type VI secretion system secreted protein VgrG [Chryseobacterium ginsenosidimutans]
MDNQDSSIIFGTFRRFEDWLQDPANPLVYCLLTLDGKKFLAKNSYTVELSQKTADHDMFSITVPDDALDSFEGYVMENSKNLLGKSLAITYWRFGKVRQTFTGVIGKIRNKKDEGGGYGDLHITGYAPSILLESGKDCRSFEDRTLEQIIKQVTEEYPEEAKVEVSENYLNDYNKKPIPYTVQYKESDYQFIRRLAIRHGEFFYYNGEKLIFGNSVQPLIKLGENVDLIDVEFEMQMQAQEFTFTGYDTQSGARIEKDSSSIKSEFKESLFQSIAATVSKNIFKKKPKMHFNHTGTREWSEEHLAEAVRLEKESRENLVQVRGRSKTPELKIGGRAELSDINKKAMETYRIIEITHHYNGEDYYNEFVGIPDLFNAAPYIDTEAVPKGEEQPARVTDNDDPMGMGRIRVQFPWQEEKNQTTPWIRLIQPHSGAGKGFHFIPEIGEEVLVGHESGNAEKPFVMGTHYNGSETSSYHTSGNDKKVIHTRSGTKIILNDAEGSVFIEDPSGNTYLMDGAGNINVNAPNDMTFTAGKNLNINVGQNMTTTVGQNKSNSAGMNITEVAGMNIFQNATMDYSLNATNITKIASENYSYEANNIHKSAMENIDIAAGKDYIQNSEETIHNLSGEKGHNA